MLHTIDKTKLIEKIKTIIHQDFETLKAAALATYEDATHEESKPENEYDTRGLEASYLAGAQGKRLAEIEELFAMYKFLNVRTYTATDSIGLTALIEVLHNDKKLYLFLVPKGGGLTVDFEGLHIQVIASTSPLGESLLGLKKDDIAIVENPKQELEYEILDVV